MCLEYPNAPSLQENEDITTEKFEAILSLKASTTEFRIIGAQTTLSLINDRYFNFTAKNLVTNNLLPMGCRETKRNGIDVRR